MNAKIYIDTNIFLDSILNRDNGIAKSVLFFLSDKNFEIVLNDISIEMIIPMNIKMSQLLRYFNVIVYPLTFLFAIKII